MSKGQYVHILLEPTVYLKIKASNVNMSRLGNKLFSQYFELENIEVPEEAELLSKMNECERIIKDNQEAMSRYAVLLTKARETKEKGEKIRQAQIRAMHDALKRDNPAKRFK